MISAHLILSHSLLDRIADSLGFETSPNLLQSYRKPYGSNHKKLDSALDNLHDWKEHIAKAQSAMHDSMLQSGTGDYQVVLNMPENPTFEQRTVIFAAQNLAKGAERMKRNDYNQVLLNMEMMGFGILWYIEVSRPCALL
jgi:hypothetical protein